MNFRKKYTSVILIIIILFLTIPIISIASEKSNVLDEAKILSKEVILGFEEYKEEFNSKLGGELYLVTTSSLEGKEAIEFAKEIYKEKLNNKKGLLLLIAPNEGTGTLYMSNEFIEDFNRNDILNIQNVTIGENLKYGNFDESAIDSLDEVFKVLNKSRDLNMKVSFKLERKEEEKDTNIFLSLGIFIIAILIIDTIFLNSYFINTISRALIGFRGEYKGNISPYRTSERYRGAGTGPRDDWPSDLEKKNKYGNW